MKPYVLPKLDRQSLEAMRAPPDRSDDFGEDQWSSDDETKIAGEAPVGAFPGTQADYRRSESTRSYY